MTTGRLTLPVPEPHRSRLQAIRRGELPLADVLADLRDATGMLEEALLATDLPETADNEAIDAFLARAYRTAWSGLSLATP